MTKWILSLEEFEYPARLFRDAFFITRSLSNLFESRWLAYPDSEIVRARDVVSEYEANPRGFLWTGNQLHGKVKVPKVEYENYFYGRDVSFGARRWTEHMARGCQSKRQPDIHPGGFLCRIIFLPGQSIAELSKQELLHLARVNLGWNPCQLLSKEEIKAFAKHLKWLGEPGTLRYFTHP